MVYTGDKVDLQQLSFTYCYGLLTNCGVIRHRERLAKYKVQTNSIIELVNKSRKNVSYSPAWMQIYRRDVFEKKTVQTITDSI